MKVQGSSVGLNHNQPPWTHVNLPHKPCYKLQYNKEGKAYTLHNLTITTSLALRDNLHNWKMTWRKCT